MRAAKEATVETPDSSTLWIKRRGCFLCIRPKDHSAGIHEIEAR